jgi:hypothetical protein
MRYVLSIFACCLSVMTAFANPIDEGYGRLVEGDLAGAANVWELALESNVGSATLHYNLGTVSYRQGDLPRAIAHWRMGRVLSPRDANVVHNLAVVRSELTDVLEPLDAQPALLQVATAGEWGMLGSGFLFLASLGLWIPKIRSRFGHWPPLGLALVGLGLVAVSVSGMQQLSEHPGAVVQSDGAFLRRLAVRHSDVLSELAAGTEVAVEQVHGDFALVRTSNDLRGWIPSDSVFFVGQEWNRLP